jgi:hypothetical protein
MRIGPSNVNGVKIGLATNWRGRNMWWNQRSKTIQQVKVKLFLITKRIKIKLMIAKVYMYVVLWNTKKLISELFIITSRKIVVAITICIRLNMLNKSIQCSARNSSSAALHGFLN